MELNAEQNAMLERLAKKHGFIWLEGWAHEHALAALRELLLTVQDDAAKIEFDPLQLPQDAELAHIYKVAWADYQRAIRAQDYADLFLKNGDENGTK